MMSPHSRRQFIQAGCKIGAGLAMGWHWPVWAATRARVVISKNKAIFRQGSKVDPEQVGKCLDAGMQKLFDVDHPLAAWKKVASPHEVIGIKVNCLSGRGATHHALVEAVTDRLLSSGIKRGNIIVWDRYSMDLEDAGYPIITDKGMPRCFGNDQAGFNYDLATFGAAGSRISKIMTELCDGIINLPVLKDHSIAGITMALKNMFGAIHNPNKYHLNSGNPYIADVNALPGIQGKIRLHICDAIEGQYQGGPSFMPQWRWPYGALLLSRDPVALDTIGWQIIEDKRREMGLKSLTADQRRPEYIFTAADPQHRLGVADKKSIDVLQT